MTKPMGSERSVMLISRLFLLNFLLLWQPGTTTFDDSIEEVVRNGTLPDYEVRALRLLAQNLLSSSTQLSLSSSRQISLSSPICYGYEIRCGSLYNTKNGSFRSVTEINLPGKKLDGSIHNSIGRFKNLKILDLSSNSLTGSIPSSLTKLRNLKYLDLSSNDLDGTIPSNLKGLQSLRLLSLPRNKLTGPIPDSIRYCQNLIAMSLYYNSLSGRIPKELGELSALQYLCEKLTHHFF